MRILAETEVRQLLDPFSLISRLESAFRDRFPGAVNPVRSHLDLGHGAFLLMPCYDPAGGTLGMKLVTVRNDPTPGEDRVHATFLLLDPRTGTPRLQMPAAYLTQVRTAAASALATKFLARDDVRTLAIFGTGRQAHAHIKLLPAVRNFVRLLVCGRDPARTRSFAAQMSKELGRLVEPCDAATCVREADVLCTCTTSPTPLFEGSLLRNGAHLNLVGAFQPHTREVDSLTVKRSAVAVDTYEGALAEAGDLLIPLREGVIQRDHIRWDLHALTQTASPARTSPHQVTLFKSVGAAFEDLIAAEQVEDAISKS